MIGKRIKDRTHGLGTIVAETNEKYMVEYDSVPQEYFIYDKEEETK